MHEFIALLINALSMMMSLTNLQFQVIPILPNLDIFIFLLKADNTSALICMTRLSFMQESHIVNLCRLFYQIVFYFNSMFPSCLYVHHIAVILNVEADALSCPQYHPSYEKVFQN